MASGCRPNERALGRVLEGVDLGAGVAVELDLSPPAEAVIDAALASGRRPVAAGELLRVGRDPLGSDGDRGRRGAPTGTRMAPHFAAALPRWPAKVLRAAQAAADGRVIHNAGGSEAQELAFVLAVAIAYLRALEAAASRSMRRGA